MRLARSLLREARLKRWQREELERRARAAAARDDPAGGGGSGQADALANNNGEESGRCVVCMERPRDATYACGHLCCCMVCGTRAGRCPICRRGGQLIRVFQP